MKLKILGIKIELHWSWWALVFFHSLGSLFVFDLFGLAKELLILGTLLMLVVGHELAHAMAARAYGYETTKIIMHFLGGIAFIQMDNLKPIPGIVIAAAGPIFNLWLGALSALIIFSNPADILWIISEQERSYTALGEILAYFCIANFMLGAFNLLPAYPLDGGRIFRNLVFLITKDQFLAKTISNHLSIFFAGLFLILAYFYSLPMLAIFGMILGFLVWQESRTKYEF